MFAPTISFIFDYLSLVCFVSRPVVYPFRVFGRCRSRDAVLCFTFVGVVYKDAFLFPVGGEEKARHIEEYQNNSRGHQFRSSEEPTE